MYTKTKFFLISFCLVSYYSLCQNTFVPDDNFEQALIDLGYDSGPLNDVVPTVNINNIVDLDLSPFINKISNLTGIEDFTNLTDLNFENHLVNNINLSQNMKLLRLFCNNNQLTDLNISNNINLEILWCNNNLLTSLIVNSNNKLRALDCSFNQIINLDVTQNTSLVDFVCEQNQIITIDVSNSPEIRRFQCGNNVITSLDISKNTNLSHLSCEQNQLTDLNLTNNARLAVLLCFGNKLSLLDLSQNSNLTDLDCKFNKLCGLNLKNGNNNNIILLDFESNPDLNCVVVDNANGNHPTWVPTSFLNYVESQNECRDFTPVDALENTIGTSYTLPTLINGNYFTKTDGMGVSLSAGDVITTSQTIYIYNETTCNSSESSFIIFINNEDYFIPKYFTPNSDGINDVWQVYDKLNLVNNISIYNRQGKLLKFLANTTSGWDGTFNGELLGSDSYWYEIVLNSREILRGHFALKR